MPASIAPSSTPNAGGTSAQRTAAAPTPAAGSGRSSLLGGDFETFLRMLTTQLRNQDPLSPMESTDFAVQIATFAGVEQQTLANQKLDALSSQLGTSGIARTAGWIGMEARVGGPIHHAGGARTLAIAPVEGADQAIVRISDANGGAVAFVPAPTTVGTFDWDGIGGGGNAVEPGVYTFTLESYAKGEMLGTSAVESYARILETRLEPDGTARLVLDGGIAVAPEDVRALRTARG